MKYTLWLEHKSKSLKSNEFVEDVRISLIEVRSDHPLLDLIAFTAYQIEDVGIGGGPSDRKCNIFVTLDQACQSALEF